MPQRPLSPHLSVYKFKYTLTTSILNRLTGMVLSGGLVLLVWWLTALAGGARAYNPVRSLLSHGVFKLVYALLIIAFVYHLAAGVRHLIWDTGHALDRDSARRSAWIVLTLSVIVALLLGYVLLRPGAYAQ